MSRSKKSRKPGALGAPEQNVTRNRSESDVEGRLRKRKKNRKGLKTGNRNSEASEAQLRQERQKRDPRLGSKKKIALVVEDKKKPSKQERKLSAEKELEMLETDSQLNVLLDRLENGENLGAGLQKVVDEKLDRIEVLMKQLGLFVEEDEDEEFDEETFVEPVIEHKSNNPSSDEDLLSQFESMDLKDFKE
ncbi:Der GTPase-activating protein YihI [Vibrio sp. 10N.261.55.A7]|uniref:Der GTPase-activating protein YihI n=1 Tax=Vibrio sp. 10N.261.55.A7 TaxID=1880851 RepID=UPI000C830F87|nr:Der GTPase-activating protein YihI [Vibrio sp. 10N.261.55.A7]PMK01059.1 GTPase-activating protein [Vibrio sp. 10N.261.55.A7]